ncbi:MAG: hypothetical protein BEN19_01990 [Epulopiscium sp. Nuni2H_MBin003]|nr:MAG: hypothetical protein BEN19_01990 [Epulopiscium sp. Nuni2H_MBin003]
MSEFVSYQALEAKIRARKRILLHPSEFRKLLELSNTNQILDYIFKKEAYKKFVDYSIKDMHRDDFEIVLEKAIVAEIEKMIGFMSGVYKDFFLCILQRYELHDLNLILRAVIKDELKDKISKYFIHSEKYSSIDFNKLLHARTIEEFTSLLKGSIYYATMISTNKDGILFREWHLEMKTSELYYSILIKKANKLDEADKKIATRLVGEKIDRLNIEWIYRAKKYYDVSNEEILIYSLGKGYKLSYTRMKNLCYTEDLEKFKLLANKYLNYTVFEANNDLLEKRLDKMLYEKSTKNASKIGNLLSYIVSLETIQEDIIAIIEGKRYDLPDIEIKKYLVSTSNI